MYFQRALKLNPACLDAWCLIGHEFLEMKNHHCAIEAYRHAVDTDPRDVRSWYSLGQAYEMMQMPYYALFYYRKAAQLTPDDARMWVRRFPKSKSCLVPAAVRDRTLQAACRWRSATATSTSTSSATTPPPSATGAR